MAIITKQEARTADLVKIKNERTGEVLRVVSPHDLVVGIADFMESDLRVTGNEHVTGSLYIKNGASGTLVLPGGQYAIRGGASIQVVDDGDGGFTINSLAPGSVASAPKNAPFLAYQSSGDLSNKKVLSATGPITFNPSTAQIGFNSSAALAVSSLDTNSITLGGASIGSMPFLLSSPHSSIPGGKSISSGDGVVVTPIQTGISIAVDSSVVKTSGATFFGGVSAPTITSTNHVSTNATISSLSAPSITSTTIAASSISSNVVASQKITGSITKLSTGGDYLRAGTNVTLLTGSDGSVTISAPAASGAPLGAQYLLIGSSGSGILTDERVLHIGQGLTSYDNGAGNQYSVSVSDSQVAFLTGANFSGNVSAPSFSSSGVIRAVTAVSASSFTGSLTKLSDGSPYLRAGQHVSLSTGSDGSITINAETGSFTSGPFLLHQPDANFPGSLAIIEGDGIQFDEDPHYGNLSISAKLGAGAGIEFDILPTREIVISSTVGNSIISGAFILASASGDFPSARVITSSLGINVIDGGTGSLIDLRVDPKTVAFLTGAHFTGDVRFDGNVKFTGEVEFGDPKFYSDAYFYAGLSGSLTNLNDGSSYLIAGQGISIVTSSNGSITITNNGTVGDITEVIAGLGLAGGGLSGSVSVSADPGQLAFLTGSTFTGAVLFNSGLSGSLTNLQNGESYLRAGFGISISTGSDGSVTITNEGPIGDITEVIAGLGLTGGGLSGSLSLAVDDSVVAFLTGANFTGPVQFSSGLSGSLTTLSDGTSYLKAGAGIDIQTGSDGSITISNNGNVGDITDVIAGIGLLGGGTSGSASLQIDDSVIAFRSGTSFTGNVTFYEGISVEATSSFYSTIFNAPATFNSGLSGSLTSLVDGSPYLIAGNGVIISTSSNGAVTISSAITASVSVSGRNRETVYLGAQTPQGSLITFSNLDFGTVEYDNDLIEVYLNGQLQHSSSRNYVENGIADYYVTGSNHIVFGFALEGDDTIDAVMQGGDSAPAAVLNEPIITFAPASSLLNSRIVTAGAGIDISTGSAGQVVISTNATGGNSSAFLSRLSINDQPSGVIDGVNNTFFLSNTPPDTSRAMIWLNGQLLTQGPNYDYTLTGNTITFLGDSIPVDDDAISSMYPYVEASTRYVLNERVTMSFSSGIIRGDLQSNPLDASKIMFFWNGQLMSQGDELDYTIIGKTIYINSGVLDYLDEDDIFVACYTAQSENVYYEINEEITINYNSTLGLWTANLSNEPSSPSKIMLFMNGQLLRQGTLEDFISSGNEIVMLDDDLSDSFRFYATYQYS